MTSKINRELRRTLFIWVAVRCCCTPTKILGFLPFPEPVVRIGKHGILDASGAEHVIEMLPIQDVKCKPGPRAFGGDTPFMSEEVEARKEIAIHSEDRPMSFWYSIPGFVEANSLGGGREQADRP